MLPPPLRWLATPFVAPYVALTRSSNLNELTQTARGLGLNAVQVQGRGELRFQGEIDGFPIHVDPVFMPIVYVLFGTQKPLRLDWRRHGNHVSSCTRFEPPDRAFRRTFRCSLIKLSYRESIPDERLAPFTGELVAFSKRWRGTLDRLKIDDDGIVCELGYVPLAPRVSPEVLGALVPDVVKIARCFDVFGDDGWPVERKGHFPAPVG